MNLNTLKNIYQNSPYFIKRWASFLPNSVLFGKAYEPYKKLLHAEIDIHEYQLQKIKETLYLAYHTVPYYQKLFKKIDFHPDDFTTIDQVKALPTIDKNIVRENYNDLINLNCKQYFEVTTGGSSGDPMHFLQSNNVWAKELAFVHTFFEEYGYDYSMKVTIRGGSFTSGRIYQFNPINNEIQLSPFLISKQTIHEYARILNKFKPRFLHGYPSALRVLMENLKAQNIALNFDFEAIFLISENVQKEDLTVFSNFYGGKVTAFYGHSERLIFAPLISDEIQYKTNDLYGYAFEKDNELIATSFDNAAMPLINFKTNDFVESWQDGTFKIQGRWDGASVIGQHDEKISLTALNVHSSVFDRIISFQFIQKEKGKATIACVPKTNLSTSEVNKIQAEFNQKTLGAVKFEVIIINQPILTERGKFNKLITDFK